MPRSTYPGTKGRMIESQILRKQRRSAARRQRYHMASSGVSRSELMSIVKSNAGETKYFDVGIQAGVTFAGTTWADSEVPCDNYVNSSGTAAAYTDSCLIPTANGAGYGQVNGNKYTLKGIRIRGSAQVSALSDQADSVTGVRVRLMLVEDSQPNGTQAQGEDIIQDVGEAGENLYSFLRIPSALGRFRILKDKYLLLQPAITGTDGANTNSIAFNIANWKMNVKMNTPVNIRSGNSTPTIAGTINKNYFLLAAAVNQSSTPVAVVVSAASRAYYND
jgi:hypothetical protein